MEKNKKIIYLNYGEGCKDVDDHHSYVHAWKKNSGLKDSGLSCKTFLEMTCEQLVPPTSNENPQVMHLLSVPSVR